LIDRPLFRALATSAVLASAIILAGCNAEQLSLANNAKANKPVPEKLVSEMQTKDMDLQSPMLVRLFKQEAELEVWKQDRSGKFALLKTYPICRWSGDLGPKVREGDRQAPEGFYSITPTQMNPQSSFYLSFNMGYPNAFDKALGRTGSQLMVHGDCSSRGCYAMTDEQISEIYALGREAFFGGQRAFQVQAYPFKMTPQNFARHRNNPNMPFWRMLKQGNDHFEVTRQEPKVDFCENKYVFDAEQPASGKPLTFTAGQRCPQITIPAEIAEAVTQKQREDDAKINELIARGTAIAQRRPDIDGGMNKIFASKIPDGSTGLSDGDGPGLQSAALTRAPGTIPPTVNPPKSALNDGSMLALAATSRVASASPESDSDPKGGGGGSGFFSGLAKRVGMGGSSETNAPKADEAAKPAKAAPAPKLAVARPATVPAASGAPKASAPTETAAAAPASSAADPIAATLGGSTPAQANATGGNSFDSRFGSFR
jgi:murein L,D-transpeptidase YafK